MTKRERVLLYTSIAVIVLFALIVLIQIALTLDNQLGRPWHNTGVGPIH